jgi:hypothetical protein
MSLKLFSALLVSSDDQRINTLARTITYKYVDVNGNFSIFLPGIFLLSVVCASGESGLENVFRRQAGAIIRAFA